MNIGIPTSLKLPALSLLYIAVMFTGTAVSPYPPGNISVFCIAPGIAALMVLYFRNAALPFIFISVFIFNYTILSSEFDRSGETAVIIVSAATSTALTVQAFLAALISRKMDTKEYVFNPDAGIRFFIFACAIPAAATAWAVILAPYKAGLVQNPPESLAVRILFFTAVYSLGIYLLLPVYFLKYSPKFKMIFYSWKLPVIISAPLIITTASYFIFEPFLFLLIPLMILTAHFSGIFGVMIQSIIAFASLIFLIPVNEEYFFLLSSGFSYPAVVCFILSISITSYYIAISVNRSDYVAENLEKKVKERTEALQLKNSDLLVLATTDPLTGLANRRHWEQISALFFTKSVRYESSLSILMCDVDHFKRINDTHGHHIGDIVLIEISSLLVILLRASDLIGRYGGEEFIILLNETDTDHAIKAAEKIRGTVEKFFHSENDLPLCTVSIGISSVSHEDRSLEECIIRADKALYSAKKNGRNKVVLYSPDTCPDFISNNR
jgi:diguanylate cyclase (GGDEF)-like protein